MVSLLNKQHFGVGASISRTNAHFLLWHNCYLIKLRAITFELEILWQKEWKEVFSKLIVFLKHSAFRTIEDHRILPCNCSILKFIDPVQNMHCVFFVCGWPYEHVCHRQSIWTPFKSLHNNLITQTFTKLTNTDNKQFHFLYSWRTTSMPPELCNHLRHRPMFSLLAYPIQLQPDICTYRSLDRLCVLVLDVSVFFVVCFSFLCCVCKAK